MSLLAGKVALVTGAGSGLGREYALAFARQSARVLVNDVGATVSGEAANERSADAVVRDILALGGEAVANYSSVTDWAGAEQMVTDAVARFGRLDVVVNNAGINRPSSLVHLTERDSDLQIDVHLKGTLAVSHFAAQWWARQPHEASRSIINTTSAVGLHPVAGSGVYSAAKAGIIALTLSHAQELAKYGVRVNAVAPCARTRMVRESPEVLALMPERTGFDRHAPEHVAPLVVYLASTACNFTGRVFAIEGPDVAIYHPFGVEHHFSSAGAWTVDGLIATLAGVSRTSEVDAFFPGGITKHHSPPRRTLRQIGNGCE